MSGSVNRVILVGNLARDPEVRTTNSGAKIVNMTVVTSEKWKDRDSGQTKERAEYNRIVIFSDRLADVAERYLQKGAKVYIEGSLQTRKWTDKEGVEKYTTEIVLTQYRGELTMLGGREEGGGESRQSWDASPSDGDGRIPARPGHRATIGKPPKALDDLSDSIPF